MVPPQIYNLSYYQGMSGDTSYKEGIIDKRFYEAFALADIKEGMNILDLGTGRGEMAVLCAKDKARVFAIDYSSESIRISRIFAQKKLGRKETSKISFRVMNAKNLKFSDAYFDRVFFLETLEHLYPEESYQVLIEIKRVLKPKGKLILSTGPNKLLIKPLLLIGTLLTKNNTWESRKYHVNEQSFFDLKKLLTKYEFKYTLVIGHSKNWIAGQIKHLEVSPFVKKIADVFNKIFDSDFFMSIRQLPLLNIYLGTHFLCLCEKRKDE